METEFELHMCIYWGTQGQQLRYLLQSDQGLILPVGFLGHAPDERKAVVPVILVRKQWSSF